MASYHFSAQVIQRSKGRSAVAAAAYRSGSKLYDERCGESHDFSWRRGVEWSGILLPDGAAEFLQNREALWNHAERLEGRRDAQVAREINLALPRELDAGQRRATLLNFVREAFVDRGMVADVAIHAPVPEKGENPDNHHAHIMLTMRRATKDGLHRVKTREWNSDSLLESWRALWATHQNRALERAGLAVRVDHRTLEAQRADAVKRRDRVAAILLHRQPQIHVGPKAGKIAGRKRALRSRDRMVGPYRRRENVRPTRRVVRYTAIDRQSRAAYRAMLVQRQKLRMAGQVQRWQARAARLQLRKFRLERIAELARVDFRRLTGQRDEWRWLERREQGHSLARQVEDAARRLVFVRRRRGQLDVLLAEVDRVLAGLLLSQGRRPERAARPLQSNTPRAPLMVRPGRSRARYPIGPSSAGFDSA
jgi:hypothetical protein